MDTATTHIKWTRYSDTRCLVNHCPTCDRMRRMLCQFEDWYGNTLTCCGCGDMWTDGEMHARPFAPGWRRHNVTEARKVLASIGITV